MTRARASYWGSAVIFGFREAPTRCFEERLDPSPAVSIFGTEICGRDRVSAAFVLSSCTAPTCRRRTRTRRRAECRRALLPLPAEYESSPSRRERRRRARQRRYRASPSRTRRRHAWRLRGRTRLRAAGNPIYRARAVAARLDRAPGFPQA